MVYSISYLFCTYFIKHQKNPFPNIGKGSSGHFFYLFKMAGVEGLEPPAPGFGDRYFRVMQNKMVAFVINTTHHLPPIPIQNLAQVCTASCNGPSCFSFSSSCLLILTSQSPFHRFCRTVQPWPLSSFGLVNKGQAYLTPMLFCVALQNLLLLPCSKISAPAEPIESECFLTMCPQEMQVLKSGRRAQIPFWKSIWLSVKKVSEILQHASILKILVFVHLNTHQLNAH